jgi:hypothetical protein
MIDWVRMKVINLKEEEKKVEMKKSMYENHSQL